MTSALKKSDPELFQLIQAETRRQQSGLEMIPSENFVSEAVLEANGSVLTNKYAEGLPGKRYYGGCEVIDKIEQLAIDRAKKLFGADFVNVQSHSGAGANEAAMQALIKHGDTVMGMKLDQGGHLTHGSPVNFSGKFYNIVAYGVRQSDELIDEEQVFALAREHKPRLIICGASAYPRKIDFAMFRRVCDEVGAFLMADVAHYAGLIAAGIYPTPVPYADIVTSTTHKTLRGPRSGFIMGKAQHEKAVNKIVFPGLQGGPHEHTIAAKAVAFLEAMQPEFKNYAVRIVENAKALALALASHGVKIVSGGTDSHIVLMDLRPLGVTGKEAQAALDAVEITANKNTIPFDPQPPMVCSGIRLGTPALTTRGMGPGEMQQIAAFIKDAIDCRADQTKLAAVKEAVHVLAERFPLYPDRAKT